MKNILFAIIVLIAFGACNSTLTNNSDIKKDSFDTSSTPITIQVPNNACYLNVTGKDSVYLKLEKFPNVVTGILKYKFHEKDSNAGNIEGVLHSDTLIADYTFMSEGQQSVRQVAFLVKDNMVTEGYADMEEKDGKMVFKNLSSIDFSKGLQLKKIDCPIE